MKKLTAMDASFLYTENEKTPNHVASVQILELPENSNVEKFIFSLKEYFMRRIHLVPYLTRKIKFVPGNIDHPVWVEDADFNVNNHLEHVELPVPGSFNQLEEKVAEIHAELMDRDRPLWKLFIISGLKGGKIAYYNQAHHAAMDGMAGQAATKIMMDTTAAVTEIELAPKKAPEDDSMLELFRASFENFATFQINAPAQSINVIEAAFRVAKRAIDSDMASSYVPISAPKTRYNRSVEKTRSYAAGDMMVADLKAMAKISGGTLNDIFLAICAGGLRRNLLRTNELPSHTLIAGCPVSLRKPGDVTMDNKVSSMSVPLSTNIEDSRLRLNAIINSSRIAKEGVRDTASLQSIQTSWFGLPAWIISSYRLSQNLRLADFLPVPFNLIISNVPGPRETLYSNGAKMLTHYPVSIPADGLGLNITASSYTNKLYFSITACAKAVPEARILRDDIMAACTELRSSLMSPVVEKTNSKVLMNTDVAIDSVKPAPVFLAPTGDRAIPNLSEPYNAFSESKH